MYRDKGNGTAYALLQEWRQPIEALRDARAVGAGAVSHARGAEEDVGAGIGRHVLLESGDGGADVHVRLARVVGFVERHEVVGPGARGCGFDGRVPAGGVDGGGAPEGRDVLQSRREALGRGGPVVAPG